LAFLQGALAASAVKVSFTLYTTDKYGVLDHRRTGTTTFPARRTFHERARPHDSRHGGSPQLGPAGMLNAKARQAGFVVVSCSFSGKLDRQPGTVWVNDNPRIAGYEDYDYITEVINRVRASDN
jgi:hypothetical protein